MDEEREELNWLLTSGVLGRSHNLAQMLKFVCEKHFEGQASQVTEYALAVEALGRRSDFNPQVDTIVRVTTHQLRKRLHEIYTGAGADRPVHILIPAGQYAPSFIRNGGALAGSESSEALDPNSSSAREAAGVAAPSRRRWLRAAFTLASAILFAGVLLWVLFGRMHMADNPGAGRMAAGKVMGHPLRALLGDGRKPYVDSAGNLWSPGNFCTGGTSLSEPARPIAGTQDPAIFLGGVRGHAHCVFPVDAGVYQVHLLFAEASDLQEATSRAVFSLNGGDNISLDVVDDAGGIYVADTKVFRGIRPENDGAIHIDYVSEISALKAVEILPAASEALLPIRIVTGNSVYKDGEGNTWLPDRYFMGGRPGQRTKTFESEETGLYRFHRVGSFRYILPVAPGEKYRVRLYFQEPWFGNDNVGIGGPGSRVFDIWCNGATLLNNFDIFKEAGSKTVVKTFDNVEATAQGKIVLTFTPVVNYPLINAIEVLPEPAQ